MLRWFPENVSTYGGQIDSIFILIFFIVGIWFVAAEVFLVFCVWRYRRRPASAAAYVRGDRWSELAWLLVPAAVILALDLGIDSAGGPVWALVKERRPSDGVMVRVTAKQFNWNVTYAGPDNTLDTADDLTIENELHVPVGTNVLLQLQSNDVIHSFFLPNLRFKQDVVPGRTIPGWFNATKAGTYEMPCAELCGFGHSGMRGFLFVHSPQEYAEWQRAHWPAAAAGANGGAA